jgi:alkanesulfonate monooxygenase SsuD/methylene tetrahydromethanopterin reductase-like flavin-dependent oxidoreductase (luciferase family)
VRVGVVILPTEPWPQAAATWRRAEELGFASAWVYDHVRWRGLPDSPWLDAFSTLAAVAAVTERIRIGPMVTTPNFRHPVPAAKAAVAVDRISGGRLELGIGAGGTPPDATVLGGPAPTARERAERLVEWVELLDRLLRRDETTFAGRHWSAEGAWMSPGCVQRPRVPFAIAGNGRRGMALAARVGEAWVTDARGGPPVAAGQVARLEEACAAAGRDPASLRRIALTGRSERPLDSLEAFRDAAGRYREAGITELLLHWPRLEEPHRGNVGILERIAADLPPPTARAE